MKLRTMLGMLMALGLAGSASSQTTVVPSFSVSDATAVEGSGQIVFTVKKHGTLNNLPSTVTIKTASRTAVANSDYIPISTTLTFAANELAKQVVVKLVDDKVAEPQETFALLLTAGTNSRLYDGTGVGTINDDDSGVVTPVGQPLTASDVTVSEAAGTAKITVSRTGDLSQASKFNYTTSDGTAKNGADYTGKVGSATIAAGNKQISFSIPILQDSTYEGTEAFYVTITPVNNATITKGVATVTVTDDDPVPPPPVTWTKCADENGTCYVVGSANVRYGSGTTWTTPKPVTGSIGCNNGVFGDPTPGIFKLCQTDGQVGTPPPPPPPTNQTCPGGEVILSTQTCPAAPTDQRRINDGERERRNGNGSHHKDW
jgi:hypothetical protein